MRQLKIIVGIGLAYHYWRCFYSNGAPLSVILIFFSVLSKIPDHYVGSLTLSYRSLKANMLGPVPRHWGVSTCIHNVKCALCCFKAKGYCGRRWEDPSLLGNCFIFLTLAFISACGTGTCVILQLLSRVFSVGMVQALSAIPGAACWCWWRTRYAVVLHQTPPNLETESIFLKSLFRATIKMMLSVISAVINVLKIDTQHPFCGTLDFFKWSIESNHQDVKQLWLAEIFIYLSAG